MAKPRPRIRKAPGAVQAAAGVSWLALVAATTLGAGSLHRVRAAVSGDPRSLGDSREGYRLIVQSYAPESLGSRDFPGLRARPLGSTQRAVTREELERGVAVDLVGLDQRAADAPVVVAWVERGPADLEFDALRARPSAGAVYGVASVPPAAASGAVRVVLSRRRS